jgi:Methyltransferase domain
MRLLDKLKDRTAPVRFRLRALTGAPSHFGIAVGYRHRDKPIYFDDTQSKDEWQREVYQRAKALFVSEGLTSICDVGCGSAYKLMQHFADADTLGLDLPPTVAFLEKKYPGRRWQSVPFTDRSLSKYDMVICADVIEHVDDPDELMAFLKHLARRYLVISTPAREKYEGRYYYGPPSNPAHLREWTFDEFGRYAGSTLNVIEHCMTNVPQQTQMVVASMR